MASPTHCGRDAASSIASQMSMQHSQRSTRLASGREESVCNCESRWKKGTYKAASWRAALAKKRYTNKGAGRAAKAHGQVNSSMFRNRCCWVGGLALRGDFSQIEAAYPLMRHAIEALIVDLPLFSETPLTQGTRKFII